VTSKKNPRVESKNDAPREGDARWTWSRKRLEQMNDAFAKAMRAAPRGAGIEVKEERHG
jgi:hypothetical protein